MRVFVGPVEISGIGDGLQSGMSRLGHVCDVITSAPHPFAYGGRGPQHWTISIWQHIGAIRSKTSRRKVIRKSVIVGLHWLWSWLVLAYCLPRYDGFIFLFAQTITNSRLELWLLKALRKKLVFSYVGSDARPPYLSGVHVQTPLRDKDIARLQRLTRRMAARLSMQERYADQIVSCANVSHFSTRRLIDWFAIGIPRAFGTEPFTPRPSEPHHGVTVLHSPSNPTVKGTALIQAAVERLKARNVPIELVMIQNMPNEAVLAEIAKCDFVIDQAYSDTPMAGFATEAAHFSKPCAVSGYFAPMLSDYVRGELIPPSEYVLPEDLEAAIERLASDAEYRTRLGAEAKRYVDMHWSALAVAERYLRLLTDDVPEDWYFDPADTLYVGGVGLSQGDAAAAIAGMVRRHGASSLRVDDKPALKARLLDLAEGHVR